MIPVQILFPAESQRIPATRFVARIPAIGEVVLLSLVGEETLWVVTAVTHVLAIDPYPEPNHRVWAYVTVDYPPEA